MRRSWNWQQPSLHVHAAHLLCGSPLVVLLCHHSVSVSVHDVQRQLLPATVLACKHGSTLWPYAMLACREHTDYD